MNVVEVNGSRMDLLATKFALSSSSTSKRLAQLQHLEDSLSGKGTLVFVGILCGIWLLRLDVSFTIPRPSLFRELGSYRVCYSIQQLLIILQNSPRSLFQIFSNYSSLHMPSMTTDHHGKLSNDVYELYSRPTIRTYLFWKALY